MYVPRASVSRGDPAMVPYHVPGLYQGGGTIATSPLSSKFMIDPSKVPRFTPVEGVAHHLRFTFKMDAYWNGHHLSFASHPHPLEFEQSLFRMICQSPEARAFVHRYAAQLAIYSPAHKSFLTNFHLMGGGSSGLAHHHPGGMHDKGDLPTSLQLLEAAEIQASGLSGMGQAGITSSQQRYLGANTREANFAILPPGEMRPLCLALTLVSEAILAIPTPAERGIWPAQRMGESNAIAQGVHKQETPSQFYTRVYSFFALLSKHEKNQGAHFQKMMPIVAVMREAFSARLGKPMVIRLLREVDVRDSELYQAARLTVLVQRQYEYDMANTPDYASTYGTSPFTSSSSAPDPSKEDTSLLPEPDHPHDDDDDPDLETTPQQAPMQYPNTVHPRQHGGIGGGHSSQPGQPSQSGRIDLGHGGRGDQGGRGQSQRRKGDCIICGNDTHHTDRCPHRRELMEAAITAGLRPRVFQPPLVHPSLPPMSQHAPSPPDSAGSSKVTSFAPGTGQHYQHNALNTPEDIEDEYLGL